MSPYLEELAQVVRDARRRKGLSQADVRKRGGPSTGWLGALEAGTMADQPKPGTLERLARVLDLDVNVLMRLSGYVKAHEPASLHGYSGQAGSNHAAAMVSGTIGKYGHTEDSLTFREETLSSQETEGIPDTRGVLLPLKRVPLYGPVAAGEPLTWTPDDAIGTVAVLADEDIDAAFVVRGDSVSAEGIQDGDVVYVKRMNGHKPHNNDIVVVETEGSYCCKVYRRDPKGTLEFLESRVAGCDPEPMLFTGEVRLLGIVESYRRRLRR